MDVNKLIELLRGTTHPSHREEAEKWLRQVHKIIGFAPSLLELVMMTNLEMSVRQAGVIYLKNLVLQFWQQKEQEPWKPALFHIHEQDRAMIRDSIIDATVQAPELIRIQLAVCVNQIIKHDFPGRWTEIVDKISIYLQLPDTSSWMGVIMCLYQLVKNYEYKKLEERGPLHEAMNLLLPLVHQNIIQLLPDHSETSVLIQKQILKVFHSLVHYFLPLDLLPKHIFASWMEVFRAVLDSSVPEAANLVEEDERQDLSWWKCKKWAMRILIRIFERYGSPGKVTKGYREFAEYYLEMFSAGILQVMLKLLDQYCQKIYVSPRVLQQIFHYMNQGIGHAHTWKLIKPHMMEIIKDIIFPLMCYTDDDDEMWKNDPHEYVRWKFDVFREFISPITAVQTLLHSVAKKRKEMLDKTMAFVMPVLTDPSSNPRHKDGALHMLGTVADILIERSDYEDKMETILVTYVYPEFHSHYPYLRASACWLLHYFHKMKFSNDYNLIQAVQLAQHCLIQEKELPVKVEAAVTIQMLILSQEKAQEFIRPQVKTIALELLKIIRETENDDLTNIMQHLVCVFAEELAPIAVEMTDHLVQTFLEKKTVFLDGTDGSTDEKAVTTGILNAIETILSVMEDEKKIMLEVEPYVLHVVGVIFSQNIVELYEEALSLTCSLTCNFISPDSWKVFEMMYLIFQNNGIEYFTDMMPSLHNFIRVDSSTFLSNHNHLLAIYEMCNMVLRGNVGEDAECHAAKLLEVVILQCKGQIDQCIPSFVELVLERLTREVRTSELRTMCLQVVIASLFYNPALLMNTLEKIHLPNVTFSVTSHFIQQWIHDTDCFLGLHDRKLCILGLCTLIAFPPQRPAVIQECAKEIIPSLLLLFDGLRRAYTYLMTGFILWLTRSNSRDDKTQKQRRH
ncbi:importin-7-like isoform X2 [Tachypleus tridentatus]|uniref:importin-7-like isoform X2 n=1 Tax=Tachypleus tridentatus TaxID=6853 RepID=UPI003FD2C92C